MGNQLSNAGHNGAGTTTGKDGTDTPSSGTGASNNTGASSGAPAGGNTGTTTGAATGTGATATSVTLALTRLHPGTVSFGVPLAPGALASASTVQVLASGTPLPAKVGELLKHYDASGKPTSVAAVRIQLPANAMPGNTLNVEVRFSGGKADTSGLLPYAQTSADAPATANTTVRSIASSGGLYQLTEGAVQTKTLFVAREPNVVASFPDGYLANTGVLGKQVTAAQVEKSGSAGTKFLSEQFSSNTLSSMYADNYAVAPESVTDFDKDYSAWLYDRCATYLTAFSHFGDVRFAQYGYKSCTYFASRIGLSGASTGIFTGKPDPDLKYSHARGLHAYYALTGDESALAAGKAIANMWLGDTLFVGPYRAGHVRGLDKLWTERLLAASLEGLLYGFQFTGDTQYLIAVEEMIATAYKHITGNAADLAQINPGANFPPQNCFIHSGLQQSEAEATDPWCSPWMSELLVDPLLQYQALTNNPQVDEIFIRLGRFLRDVGTSYFTKDPVDDTFLSPSVCDDPNAGTQRRRLIPLYGAGLNASGKRVNKGEWSDFEHCADATALTAAALRALVRTGQYDKRPIGPFKNEGDSILQLHQELLSCAQRTFEEETRPMRIPAAWTSAQLKAGASNPAAFILNNKIGFPSHMLDPARKISWWFNTSLQEFKLMDEAGIRVDALSPGKVQVAGCK